MYPVYSEKAVYETTFWESRAIVGRPYESCNEKDVTGDGAIIIAIYRILNVKGLLITYDSISLVGINDVSLLYV